MKWENLQCCDYYCTSDIKCSFIDDLENRQTIFTSKFIAPDFFKTCRIFLQTALLIIYLKMWLHASPYILIFLWVVDIPTAKSVWCNNEAIKNAVTRGIWCMIHLVLSVWLLTFGENVNLKLITAQNYSICLDDIQYSIYVLYIQFSTDTVCVNCM